MQNVLKKVESIPMMPSSAGNKRSASEALEKDHGKKSKTISSSLPQTASSNEFWLSPIFSQKKLQEPFPKLTNWSQKALPMLVRENYKVPNDGVSRTQSLSTCMMAVQFANMSKDGTSKKHGGDGNAVYDLCLVPTLPTKVTDRMPRAQADADACAKWLYDTPKKLIEAAWDMEGVMTKWKEKAKKLAAKEAKKKGDDARSAKAIFLDEARYSVHQECTDRQTGEDAGYIRDDKGIMFKFACNMRIAGKDNRPQCWKPYTNKFGVRDVRNITHALKNKKNGFYQGTVVKVGFEMYAYDYDGFYGVKATLKPHVLVLYEPDGPPKQTIADMMKDDFFDDE